MAKEFQFESQTTYTFLEEIGRGGMGIVYLAERNSGGVLDYVVLKTIKSLNKEDEESLRQEANLAALLRHENIVKTYGLEAIPLSVLPREFLKNLGALSYVAEPNKPSSPNFRRLNFKRSKQQQIATIAKSDKQEDKLLLLIVMDYIDGINLKSLHFEHMYQSLLLPVPMAAFIISRIARALAYSHHYIIHRDVSPENILLNTQGICKLTDFGIAVASHQQPDYWAGKLSYMAPEQIYNQPIDERLDIFSLGSVAYQLITGIPLVEVCPEMDFEQQIQSVKQQLLQGIMSPSLLRNDIPEELSQIILKMVAPSPHKRYQRASEVANDFEKKYLYAKGYGPTNNSLATYLNIFENRFATYHEDQIQQLSFLKNDKGETQLKRQLQLAEYTEAGLKLLEQRKNSEIYKRLKATSHLRQVQVQSQEEKLPYLKLKHLDNVIEAFVITEKLSIGQSEKVNVSLVEKGIAAHHCDIGQTKDNTVMLKVHHELPATTVNGVPAMEKELKDGDKLKIGNYLMFFINQKRAEPQSQFTLSLDKEADLVTTVAQAKDFTVEFKPQQESLTRMARLVDYLLSFTALSELKLGILPTALVEAVQLLKPTSDNNPVQIQVIRRPIYLIFHFVNLTEQGYNSFLGNFKKHREMLTQEIEQKEKSVEDKEFKSAEIFGDDNFWKNSPAANTQEEVPDDINIEDFDSSKMAAQLIVHGFDRIELQKDKHEVELVIYL